MATLLPSPSNIISKIVEPLTDREFEELMDKQCAICKDEATRPVRLGCRCGSVFCNTCLRLALATGSESCPLCRTVGPSIVSLRRYTHDMHQVRRQSVVNSTRPRRMLLLYLICSEHLDTLIMTSFKEGPALLSRTREQGLVIATRVFIAINAQLLVRASYVFLRPAWITCKHVLYGHSQALYWPQRGVSFGCVVAVAVTLWYSATTIYLTAIALSAMQMKRGIPLILQLLVFRWHSAPPVALRDVVKSLVLRTCIAYVGLYLYIIIALIFSTRGKRG